MTWSETRLHLRADLSRLDLLTAASGRKSERWIPSVICVVLYRCSHFFASNRHRLLGRLCWQLNHFLTSGDLSPAAAIGPGFVVFHPAGVMIHGAAGRDLTVVGRGGFGGGLGEADIGAGPGCAVLGDEVFLEMGAMILGPQRIGNRVRIGANCTVIQSLPDGAVVLPLEAKLRRGAPQESPVS